MLQKILKSRNPIFNKPLYRELKEKGAAAVGNQMTIGGAVAKSFILGFLALATAVPAYMYGSKTLMWVGIIGAMVMLGLTRVYKDKAMFFGSAYALFKGLFVGTAAYNNARLVGYTEIIFQAFLLTSAILFVMLALYNSGLVKVTEKFRSVMSLAVGGVMLYYLINMGLNMFGVDIPYIHEGGIISIAICGVIMIIASLRLLINFDNFRRGAKYKASKQMEWYFATGLVFTIIWLYVESLRMLRYLAQPAKRKRVANQNKIRKQKAAKQAANPNVGNKKNKVGMYDEFKS